MVVPVQALINSTIAAGPQSCSQGGSIMVRQVTVFGIKALAGTVNAAPVLIGFSATANQQPVSIAAGASLTITMPQGAMFDLNQLKFQVGADGDGVLLWYW